MLQAVVVDTARRYHVVVVLALLPFHTDRHLEELEPVESQTLAIETQDLSEKGQNSHLHSWSRDFRQH